MRGKENEEFEKYQDLGKEVGKNPPYKCDSCGIGGIRIITVLLEKMEGRDCFIVDVACPFETRVAENEREMIDDYQDLKVEVAEVYMSCLL